MTQSQSTKNEQKRMVVILGLGDLGIRFARTVAERGLATDLKLVSRGEVAVQWAPQAGHGPPCLERENGWSGCVGHEKCACAFRARSN